MPLLKSVAPLVLSDTATHKDWFEDGTKFDFYKLQKIEITLFLAIEKARHARHLNIHYTNYARARILEHGGKDGRLVSPTNNFASRPEGHAQVKQNRHAITRGQATQYPYQQRHCCRACASFRHRSGNALSSRFLTELRRAIFAELRRTIFTELRRTIFTGCHLLQGNMKLVRDASDNICELIYERIEPRLQIYTSTILVHPASIPPRSGKCPLLRRIPHELRRTIFAELLPAKDVIIQPVCWAGDKVERDLTCKHNITSNLLRLNRQLKDLATSFAHAERIFAIHVRGVSPPVA
ncbi:unnamed protein product [Zymoseptoria tritici ST99CH_3D1]|nr:unnamed protein product [Zymoseptoria tritici ST99CH_3D1]